MKSVIAISALILLTGCAHRPVRPHLDARHCDEGSYPVKAKYHDEVLTVCAIITPECAHNSRPGQTCPIVGFIGVGEVNTFLDPDADDADSEMTGKHHRWQIWKKSGKDRD